MGFKLEKLYHGACYYPELWDDTIVREDIIMMKQAGINMVRIGEFWWSKIEPDQGNYNTRYIVDLLDLLHKSGIDVIMCTPTPTPPIWLTHEHPERLHVDDRGQRMIHGSRQHICTNNDDYRRASYKIIEKIAEAVKNHPAVIMWQLDNEFKCHIRECFCETCAGLWREWLRKKYGTIENLNKAWGTMVWSTRYQSFEQVVQPKLTTPFLHSASNATNYKIFTREKIAQFASEQTAIIRKYSQAPVTTNAALDFGIDNELLFKDLDMAAFDTYASQSDYHIFVMNCDIWRGIKKDRNFWLLETTTSHTGALDRMAPVLPNGYLVSEAVVCFALGGAGFTYWLWRQQAYGCEINHSAVISAWGKPGVGYKNVQKVEEARRKIEPFITSTKFTPGDLAITYSDKARLFMETENHKHTNYLHLMQSLYISVLKTGFHRDLVPESTDLTGYKMLITPFMYHLSDEYLSRAKAFVEAGGIWIAGPMTGGRTAEHSITTDAALGADFEDFAGVEALYTYTIDGTGAVGCAFDMEAPLTLWSTVFEPREDTRVVGVIRGGVTDGLPFITERQVGRGRVVMIGSMPSGDAGEQMLAAIISYYGNLAGINRTRVSDGTVAIPRHDDEFRYIVAVNMDGKGGKVEIEGGGVDVITGSEIQPGTLVVKPFGYEVIKLN